MVIEDDVVIKGKVISSDAEGNVYKSLYIYDGEQAIELRLMNDNYVNYPLGQIVYVKAQGLSLAQLPLYAESGCRARARTGRHLPQRHSKRARFLGFGQLEHPHHGDGSPVVYRGELDTITEADVTVVDKDNYKTVLNDDLLGV